METITLTISAATLQTIGTALQELPYKIAQPAIQEIDTQVQAHVRKKQEILRGPNQSGTEDSNVGGQDGNLSPQ